MDEDKEPPRIVLTSYPNGGWTVEKAHDRSLRTIPLGSYESLSAMVAAIEDGLIGGVVK